MKIVPGLAELDNTNKDAIAEVIESISEAMVTYNGMTVDKKALPGDYDAFEQVLSRPITARQRVT